MSDNLTQIPLALYIHIPWCVRKCPYCDFNSHQLRDDIPEQAYITALLEDLSTDLPKIWGRRLSSIFIGGGTPSLLSGQAIEELLTGVQTLLPYHPDIEISLEANPGTVEQNRFNQYRAAGVNRLSIGVQSFQDNKLKALGRIHHSAEAVNAIHTAKKAGFANFNIDLMYGLPQQSIADALADLQQALDLQPKHLSWYHLTLEPNTLFAQRPPPLPKDDLIWEMQQQGHELLLQSGYKHYEVSAYCLPDYECKHNRNYWEFGDYLGIGAGAHSKITTLGDMQVTRFWKQRHPKDYLNSAKAFIAAENIIESKEIIFEFMLNTLRLQQSISEDLLQERTGLSFNDIAQPLQLAKQRELIALSKQQINVTPLGRRFLNDLMALFLDE